MADGVWERAESDDNMKLTRLPNSFIRFLCAFVAYVYDCFQFRAMTLEDFVIPSLFRVRCDLGNVSRGLSIRRDLFEFVDQFSIFGLYFTFG
jgi:hypothetical protein